MKHIYKSGINLFSQQYVHFSITYNSTTYGYGETFHNQNDKYRMLRSLVCIKQEIIKSIKIISKANREVTKLNKFKESK